MALAGLILILAPAQAFAGPTFASAGLAVPGANDYPFGGLRSVSSTNVIPGNIDLGSLTFGLMTPDGNLIYYVAGIHDGDGHPAFFDIFEVDSTNSKVLRTLQLPPTLNGIYRGFLDTTRGYAYLVSHGDQSPAQPNDTLFEIDLSTMSLGATHPLALLSNVLFYDSETASLLFLATTTAPNGVMTSTLNRFDLTNSTISATVPYLGPPTACCVEPLRSSDNSFLYVIDQGGLYNRAIA